MATQPAPPPHYRQEVIRMRAKVVDQVSRHATSPSIPVPGDMRWDEILEAKNILDDTSWEVVSADDNWIWFRRYMVGEYAK